MKKILKIITNIIFIISLLILFVSIYINHFFEGVSFELILYSIVNFKGTSISVILRGLIFISLIFIILFIFIKLIKLLFKKIKILDKVFKIIIKIEYILKIFIIIISLIISYKLLKIDDFYNMLRNSTSIYEDYYVDPRKVKIKFPKDKQNLIYIYLESDTTYSMFAYKIGISFLWEFILIYGWYFGNFDNRLTASFITLPSFASSTGFII